MHKIYTNKEAGLEAMSKPGRPPRFYQCVKCKAVLSSVAVRKHKCKSTK